METVTIEFKKDGYEPFIDFIKAYAIITVLIGHTFDYHEYWGYSFWAGVQVPLFVLVQSFHVLKKESPKLDVVKLFKRVLFPYLIIGGGNLAFVLRYW